MKTAAEYGDEVLKSADDLLANEAIFDDRTDAMKVFHGKNWRTMAASDLTRNDAKAVCTYMLDRIQAMYAAYRVAADREVAG